MNLSTQINSNPVEFVTKIKALIICNDVQIHESITNSLKNTKLNKFEIRLCKSINQAFEILKQNPFNAVFISANYLVNLSMMTALELVNQKIQVIVFGQSQDLNLISKLKEIGFKDHLLQNNFSADFFYSAIEILYSKALATNNVQSDMVKQLTYENKITRKTLDNAPIGVVKLDANLKIQEVNATIAKLLNIDRQNLPALIGSPIHKIFQQLTISILEPVLSGEKIHLESFEINYDSTNLKAHFWDISAWSIVDDKNLVINIMILITDVTERVNLNKQREDIIATLAHDLKTPLIGAERTLESLLQGSTGQLNNAQSGILSKLKQSNHHLLSMIKNLIDVYRYDSNTHINHLEACNLSNIVKTCLEELNVLIKEKELVVSFVNVSNEPKVMIDTQSITQAISNLLDNAIKFSNLAGKLNIKIGLVQDNLCLEIQDFGPGIETHELKELFTRFYQGTVGRRNAIGTGLGLYLAKQIIEIHNGSILVKSKPGEDTTFTINLPIIQSGN